jgi:hypothetical protein
MAKKNSLKLVPFGTRRVAVGRFGDADFRWEERARLLEWASDHDKKVEWRPNEPFTDTLRLDRLERGRSAARFWFVGTDGTEYPFFGQGLTDMLSRVALDHGVVTGTWIAVKRGANYGIELLEEAS